MLPSAQTAKWKEAEQHHCRRHCRSLVVVSLAAAVVVAVSLAQLPSDTTYSAALDHLDEVRAASRRYGGENEAEMRKAPMQDRRGLRPTWQQNIGEGSARSSSLSAAHDCTLEPCGWWESTTFRDGLVFASEYERAHHRPLREQHHHHQQHQKHRSSTRSEPPLPPPEPNRFHCRDANDTHPCRSVQDQGHTLLYRYRHRYRSVWRDPFEFDQSPGKYNDYGAPRAIVPSDGVSGDPGAVGHDSADADAADDGEFRPADAIDVWCRSTDKVLVTATIKKGYGLTNRLLSLSGQLALAARTGRVPAVDAAKKIRIPIHLLLNLSRSKFPQRKLRRIAVFCNYTAPIVMPKRMAPHSLQTIDRKQVALRPHKVMHLFDESFRAVAHAPLVYMHEMYLRYPFEQEGDWRLHAGALFCGMHFADWIHDAGVSVVRGIRRAAAAHYYASSMKQLLPPLAPSSSSYAAWHLRMEVSDAIAMRKGRKQTTPEHVAAFLVEVVGPLLRKHDIRTLLVCSGPLPPAIQRALLETSLALGIRVVRKEEFLPKDVQFDDFHTLGSVRERTGDGSSWTTPTATDGAAVDAVALEKADLVMMTTVSSFSAFVYAKRCGGNRPEAPDRTTKTNRDASIRDARRRGCTLVGGFYLYDTYLDGSFTDLINYPCGYQFHAYLAAPPAVIPRPPEELDVFAFRFLPMSPLFTDAQRRNAVAPGEAPPVLEQP